MQEKGKENSLIKQNILLYLERKGISQYQCYKETGITRGVLAQPNGISEENLTRFLAQYKDISIQWLVTGEGEMFREGASAVVTPIHKPQYTEPLIEEQYIPYYSWEATAGVVQLFGDMGEYEVGKIIIPRMPDCDGAVSVTGDSMYPLLKSGDIVAYKEVHDIQNIHFGDMYLISIDEDGDIYTAVKWVNKHPSDPKKVMLLSNNEHYSPREVELRHIRHIALVKFSIRYNTMC